MGCCCVCSICLHHTTLHPACEYNCNLRARSAEPSLDPFTDEVGNAKLQTEASDEMLDVRTQLLNDIQWYLHDCGHKPAADALATDHDARIEMMFGRWKRPVDRQAMVMERRFGQAEREATATDTAEPSPFTAELEGLRDLAKAVRASDVLARVNGVRERMIDALEAVERIQQRMIGNAMAASVAARTVATTARRRDEMNYLMLGKPLLWGKHCRGAGCDDFNEQCPSCVCSCAACKPPSPTNERNPEANPWLTEEVFIALRTIENCATSYLDLIIDQIGGEPSGGVIEGTLADLRKSVDRMRDLRASIVKESPQWMTGGIPDRSWSDEVCVIAHELGVEHTSEGHATEPGTLAELLASIRALRQVEDDDGPFDCARRGCPNKARPTGHYCSMECVEIEDETQESQ